ncbi:MAG TPA: hypothetical protein PL196_11365 [Burkholderiaceae bacterium]|nr:hypothetical protein [Burkholderiaceae bacterium]
MKRSLTLLALALGVTAVQALPKLGYYKARYSADTTYSCVQVTSNTKQVTVINTKVAYFEFQKPGGSKMACIPVVYFDTDDTPVDGDPVHLLIVSTTNALCTALDGSEGAEVAFSSSRFFWTGDSYGTVTLPDVATKAVAHVREKQTISAEFYSTTSCPP